MVPIYESDVAEERWSKTEWNHYELWEKVEQRIRRHNRMWIAGTAVLFLMLSSVPIVIDQLPHWRALAAVRRLGQEVDRMKREAATSHSPHRLRFVDPANGLSYQVEKVESCASSNGTPLRAGTLVSSENASQYRLVGQELGKAMAIPGLLQEFCYDPLQGSATEIRGEGVAGFGIIPAKDLAEHRTDRIAILLLSGPSAELSFE